MSLLLSWPLSPGILETVSLSGFLSSPAVVSPPSIYLGLDRMADSNSQEQGSAGLCDKSWGWLIREYGIAVS